MGTEKANNIKDEMTKLLRNELSVLRAKARVSQGDLAKKIGISRQTYSALETGKRDAVDNIPRLDCIFSK